MYLCCYLAHEFSFLGGEGTYFKLQSFFFLFRLSSIFQTCKYNFQKLKKNLYWEDILRDTSYRGPSTTCTQAHTANALFSQYFCFAFCGIKGSPVLLASCWFFTCPDSPFWPLSCSWFSFGWTEPGSGLSQPLTDSLPITNSFPRRILVYVEWHLWIETSG